MKGRGRALTLTDREGPAAGVGLLLGKGRAWDGSSGALVLGCRRTWRSSCRWASGRCSALRGKRGVLAEIEARIAADPVAIPDPPDPRGRPLPARDRDRSFRRRGMSA